MRHWSRWLALLLALLLAASPAARADEYDPQLEAMREQHLCKILTYLQAIRSQPPTPRERFLVLSAPGRIGYVQCLFVDQDRNLLCEAASGYYDKPHARYVSRKQLPALAALGFSTSARKSNYQQLRPVTDGESLTQVAEMLIRTMHGIYGFTQFDEIRYYAPLVGSLAPSGSYVAGTCAAPTS